MRGSFQPISRNVKSHEMRFWFPCASARSIDAAVSRGDGKSLIAASPFWDVHEARERSGLRLITSWQNSTTSIDVNTTLSRPRLFKQKDFQTGVKDCL